MAIGDRVVTELMSKSLTTTPGDSTYANAGANYKTQITSLILTAQSTGTAIRTVTIYKGGTAVGNEKLPIKLDPTSVAHPNVVILTEPFILNGTDAIYAKVDAGTDVNIEATGIVEQIA